MASVFVKPPWNATSRIALSGYEFREKSRTIWANSQQVQIQIQIGFIVAQINDKHQYTYIYKYKKLQLNKKKKFIKKKSYKDSSKANFAAVEEPLLVSIS